jgi:hypothetical protein
MKRFHCSFLFTISGTDFVLKGEKSTFKQKRSDYETITTSLFCT